MKKIQFTNHCGLVCSLSNMIDRRVATVEDLRYVIETSRNAREMAKRLNNMKGMEDRIEYIRENEFYILLGVRDVWDNKFYLRIYK